jgi:hypothetical protein
MGPGPAFCFLDLAYPNIIVLRTDRSVAGQTSEKPLDPDWHLGRSDSFSRLN